LSIMAYGVLKHRLMDIKSFFLLALFRLATASLILVPNVLLFAAVHPWLARLAPSLQFIFLIPWFSLNYYYFTRARPRINMFFYRSRHTLKKIEIEFIESFLALKSLDDLIDEFGKVLKKTLSIEEHGLYMKDKGKNRFAKRDGGRLKLAPGVEKWFLKTNRLIQRDIIEADPRYENVKEGIIRCFHGSGASCVMPLIRNDELIALFFLGEKADRREIDADEADFIDNITASLTAAISNSILYQEISDLKDRLEKRTVALTLEVEDRNKAEKRRRESEEKYRILAENVSDAIWIIDVKSLAFTYISPSAERLMGLSLDEALKTPPRDLLTPASLALVRSVLADELSGEKNAGRDSRGSKTLELEHLRKDGVTIPAETTMSFIRDDAGAAASIIGVTRDIRERKRLEAQLRTAKKMEAVGALAGGVAHDLNNVLSGIINYPELLLLEVPDGSPMRRPIQSIQRSGEKAAAIVQDLLTLARRGVAPSREPLNLNAIISDYLKSLEFRSFKKYHPGVRVECDPESALPNIRGSIVHLSKVVMNLIINAAEAMPDGGVVRISTESRREA
ncbi:MAG: PAS domain S-box protein, partial [Desulfobacterales bacterium]|nr:PAS domain S-box protein [Desulfobacterales bacterium]